VVGGLAIASAIAFGAAAFETVTQVTRPAIPLPGGERLGALRLARVPALIGRTLLESDEAAGAPPVLVIGYELWQQRFGGSTAAIGQNVQVGGAASTIVGVMPRGFAFPVSHDAWTALRRSAVDQGPRQGPSLHVVGRLAPGTTLAAARTELATLGQAAARRSRRLRAATPDRRRLD
jgi:hypothetical protein